MSSTCDQIENFFNSDTLNEEFFVEIVEKKLKISRESFKVKLILISPAAGKNDNYASIIYRAKIKIKTIETDEFKVVDVILKASLVNIPELKEFGVFPRERFMYENILTSFENIWFDKSGEKIQFGPQGIKFTTEPYEIIVLEDLKASGYVMLDRKEGFSVEQAKLLLSKLAKFHAISALRYQKEGVLNSSLDRAGSPVDMESDFVKGFIRMFDEFIKALERFGNCEVYIEKLKKFNSWTIFNDYLNDNSSLKCGLKCLNHGDLWVNNTMFKLNENNENVEVLLIDFQMGFWGSPMIDLLSFILTSIGDDFRTKHFDEFIEFYHTELCSALKIIGYEHQIPTLEEFYDELKTKSSLAVLSASYLFFIKYSHDEAINLELMMAETDDKVLSEIYDKIYKCPILEKSIKQLLPFLNERGFLDNNFIRV